jgi:hypothetical protein
MSSSAFHLSDFLSLPVHLISGPQLDSPMLSVLCDLALHFDEKEDLTYAVMCLLDYRQQRLDFLKSLIVAEVASTSTNLAYPADR